MAPELSRLDLVSPWPALEASILAGQYPNYGNRAGRDHAPRRRIHWLRWSWIHWHCHARMRIGRCEYAVDDFAVGWQIAPWRVAACPHCGFFREVLR